MALHARAQQREAAEDGIERVERARAGDDQQLGALRPKRGELVGHDPRRAARVANGKQAAAEPFDLLLQRRLESRALLRVETLLGDGADRRRLEGAHRHQPVRVPRDLLDGAERLGGDHERRHLALGDGFTGLDRLAREETEDRDPFLRVRVGQRLAPDVEQAAAGRGQRPLPTRVGLHLDAVAHHGGGQSLAGLLLVQVAGLDDQQVDFFPRGREQDVGGVRRAPFSTAILPSAPRTS